MNRVPFVTFREMDETGTLRYYILQKDFPHNLGVILSQPKADALAQAPIPGYNLYVVWHSTLRGNMVAAYPDYEKDLLYLFPTMASWYCSERIMADKKRFEKFKIK